MSFFDVLQEPCIDVSGSGWLAFFPVKSLDEVPYAHLPVKANVRKSLIKAHPAIRESEDTERDGLVYVEVPLDFSVSTEALKQIIDEAYALVW